MKLPFFIDKTKLPHQPGVYLYKDQSGQVLYVGKAIDLYHRVLSYFQDSPQDPKTAVLVGKIARLETIVVLSELEALILEANLIKKYHPPFNIKLTDDKDYLYIKITKEQFPKIITARKNELEDAKEYFGPFPSAKTVKETLKKLRKIFPWCANPQGSRPCFYYHLQLCPGPCAGQITEKEYLKNIRLFGKFLQGKSTEVKKDLLKEIKKASRQLNFEKAQQFKKTLEGVEYLTQANNVAVYLENPNFIHDQNKQALAELKIILKLPTLPARIECVDISNFSGQESGGSLVVLTKGEIDKKWYRKFKIKRKNTPDDPLMIKEVVSRRFNHLDWPLPNLLLVDGGITQVRAAQSELANKSLNIPVFGLAKRKEWLYSPEGLIVKLPKSSPALLLLQKIRDEAHRFALNYHHHLRKNLLWGR